MSFHDIFILWLSVSSREFHQPVTSQREFVSKTEIPPQFDLPDALQATSACQLRT